MSDALLAAIEANDPDAAKAAILDWKPLSKKIGGKTPIERAVEAGADRVLAGLLDAGAKVTGKPHPFESAAGRGHRAVMDLLVERNAVPPDAMNAAIASNGRDGSLEL